MQELYSTIHYSRECLPNLHYDCSQYMSLFATNFSSSLEAVHQDHVLPSSFTIPQVDPISVDIDRTVQRLERQLVSQEGGGQREEEELSYQGDDILPEAAEGMGPGKYITWTFSTAVSSV